ncbi:MAG TPA: hypothetical protein VLX61_05200 [Anaerolineales bacterium]|nr:hypothetical protein [Anaerolineales bacterium]
MSMIAMWFKKSLIVAIIAALGLSAVPLVSVYAQSPNPPTTPTPGQPSSDRLQKAWAREQDIYARIGKILDNASSLISKIQARLNEAKSKGKDVTSVQTALDAFSTAVNDVQPIYTQLQTIVQSHSGFDASGNVTDPTEALQTAQDFRSKVEAIRQAGVREAGKALREAIRAFRQANQSTTPAPSSTAG